MKKKVYFSPAIEVVVVESQLLTGGSATVDELTDGGEQNWGGDE